MPITTAAVSGFAHGSTVGIMTVVVRASVSLDGYCAGPGVSVAEGMGRDGELLHAWQFADDPAPADRAAVERMRAEVGATVLGRRTYDVGVGHWNDVPFAGAAFVLTHRPGPDVPMASGTFHFTDAGIAAAVERATAAAGGRTVNVMGGETVRQALAAGLVDELDLQVVPILLGDGVRLLDGARADLECVSVTPSPRATHVHYRVRR
ncbi:hypothetical protein Actkin_03140 [Actinokineospora sp. UTMC 2448]|nr:hypothetical protein Actkin_03140 [Actinokineospora sp. UTMC 2448]